ncbi:MAG: pyridoxamine 5'-phosphate oxidase family protein [Deltaproteobacteria bacterium]|nr:pyridoxamine 5'-phosphate oxidase family protein [Deltaproteobacteria bacterium]
MNRATLSIDEKKREIIALFEKSKHMVLATCADGRVTARTMSYVNKGLELVFGTDKNFLKAQGLF